MIEFEISKKAKINEDVIFENLRDFLFDEEIDVKVSGECDLLSTIYSLPVDVQKNLFTSIGQKFIEYAKEDNHFKEYN